MSLRVITGPMYCGKSTELIRRVKKYKIAKKKCCVIKYFEDDRYNKKKVCTHDEGTYETNFQIDSFLSLKEHIKDFNVFAIDEGQFFSDIVDFCELVADLGKIVIVAGLDTNFKREPFGKMGTLMCKAEEVLKLTAVCEYCSKDAMYTMRISKETEEKVIGGKDKYVAVCRKCYNEKIC